MNEGLVAQRYATALYNFALSDNTENMVYEEAKLLVAQFGLQPELRTALANPAVSKADKQKLVITAVGGSASEAFRKLIDLALANEREKKLQHIALKYIELYRERKNIYAGKITLARKIDRKTEDRLMSVVAAHTGGTLELEKNIIPEIIGGFILEADNCRWDGSIRCRLEKIRQEFLFN